MTTTTAAVLVVAMAHLVTLLAVAKAAAKNCSVTEGIDKSLQTNQTKAKQKKKSKTGRKWLQKNKSKEKGCFSAVVVVVVAVVLPRLSTLQTKLDSCRLNNSGRWTRRRHSRRCSPKGWDGDGGAMGNCRHCQWHHRHPLPMGSYCFMLPLYGRAWLLPAALFFLTTGQQQQQHRHRFQQLWQI